MKKPYIPSATIFVYTLSSPRDGVVRYVGITNNPKQRLKDHMKTSKKDTHRKARWIRSLLRDGLKPTMTIIDETNDEEWQQCEIGWIAHYKGLGCDLVNGNEGGWGSRNPSEETRKRMSEATSGENNPLYGKHHSEESRRMMSESKRGENNYWYGKHHSEESRRKSSESQPHKKSVLQYDKLGNFIRRWDSITDASKSLDIQLPDISTCCKRNPRHKTAGGYIWRYADDPLLGEYPTQLRIDFE